MPPYRPETFSQRRDRLKPLPFGRAHEDRKYDRTKRLQGGNAVANEFRHSQACKQLRDSYFAEHPLCEDPFGCHERLGIVSPTEDIHHVVSIQKDPSLALDASNLIA